MAPQPANRTVHTRNAFTLVEMLVVIVIICILVALLMPVLSGAYRTAMKTADAALIHQIAMGCEAYNQVFHEYPPSRWQPGAVPIFANADWNAWPPPYSRPRDRIAPWPTPDRPRLVGSAKLFAYLSGFNAIGCWDPMNPLGAFDAGRWQSTLPMYNPCGTLTFRGILVHLNAADNGTSEDKVYGPYYTPDDKGQTITTIRWGTGPLPVQQMVFASRFARQASPPLPITGGEPERTAPILYYRANPAPANRDSVNAVIDTWDIYKFEDNYPITDWQAAQNANWNGYDNPLAWWSHPLYAPADGKDALGADYKYDSTHLTGGGPNQNWGISRPFAKPGAAPIPTPTTPYDANTFVLISPGPDGEYFTEDDITNFRQ